MEGRGWIMDMPSLLLIHLLRRNNVWYELMVIFNTEIVRSDSNNKLFHSILEGRAAVFQEGREVDRAHSKQHLWNRWSTQHYAKPNHP